MINQFTIQNRFVFHSSRHANILALTARVGGSYLVKRQTYRKPVFF